MCQELGSSLSGWSGSDSLVQLLKNCQLGLQLVWRFGWVWRTHSQPRRFIGLLARHLFYLHGAALVPSWHGPWHGKWPKKKSKEEAQKPFLTNLCNYTSSLLLYFVYYHQVTKPHSRIPSWREEHQRVCVHNWTHYWKHRQRERGRVCVLFEAAEGGWLDTLMKIHEFVQRSKMRMSIR